MNQYVNTQYPNTDASRQALISMLNLVLDRKEDPITEVTVINSVHKGFKPSDKSTIMDIRAKTLHHEQFNIEMQNKAEDSFTDRTLMYGFMTSRISIPNSRWQKKPAVIS